MADQERSKILSWSFNLNLIIMNIYNVYNDRYDAYYIVAANYEDEAKSVLVERRKSSKYCDAREIESILRKSTVEQIEHTSCDLQEPTLLLVLPFP